MIPIWLLILLAVIHALALFWFAYEGKGGLAMVMYGGMCVQIGLMIQARG